MADFADQAPFEGLYARKPSGRRRLSFTSQNSGRSAPLSAGSIRVPRPQIRAQPSITSVRSIADSETEHSEILHSPIPSRHFLLQTESQQWLKGHPLSPPSSRAVSPLSTASAAPPDPSASASTSTTGFRRGQTLSFGSLHDRELSRSKLRRAAVEEERKIEAKESQGAGKRWIKWMHRNRMQDYITPCMVAGAICIKWCVGLSGYSGAGSPPMFGDYEAQRHWMELTNHLPIHQWYKYDLQYWGLDYPPLTAYHSWLCGFVGSLVNPTWFELDRSRGIETPGSKVFMRSTVLVSDLLLYTPASILFINYWMSNRSKRTQSFALLSLLLQPSLLIIDSGHFQFNSVMIGFTLLSLNFFSQGQDELGAIAFVASLGFKQMALYYAPAIGSYLLGRCLAAKTGIKHFIRLGLTTTAAFILVFLPFLPPFASPSSILDPISRIFPFGRGLFEDKVANFWCASNVIIKWRLWLSQPMLLKMSTGLTALGFLPSSFNLIMAGTRLRHATVPPAGSRKSYTSSSGKREDISTPTLPILPWALLSSSLSFFLFSFQVHEKTILLPLLPLSLLMSGAQFDSFTFEWGMLVQNVALFSMWPLLRKDGLTGPYIATIALYNCFMGYNPFRRSMKVSLTRRISQLVYITILFLHLMEFLITPPRRFPDLYPVLNVLLCTPIFGITWLWSIKRSTEVTWGVSALGTPPARKPGEK